VAQIRPCCYNISTLLEYSLGIWMTYLILEQRLTH
jgi:hypothetical protein